MKYKKFIISCFFILIISGYSYSQEDIPINWSYINLSSPLDVQFINQMTGFVAVRNSTNIDILKTTNYGANWTSLIPNTTYYCGDDAKPASIYFFNENTGLFSSGDGIFKYNNGNFQRVHNYTDFYGNSKANIIHKLIFVNSNTGYAISTFKNTYGSQEYTRGNIYKTTNGGDNWNNLYVNLGEGAIFDYSYYVNDIAFSSSDNNKVIVCGYIRPTHTYQSQNTFFVRTSDGFSNFVINSNSLGSYSAVYVKNNNNVIFLRRGAKDDNPQYSDVLSIAWDNLGNTPTSLYQFQSPSNAAYNHTAMNFYDDNTGSMIVDVYNSNKKLLKTTNGGNNWNVEFDNVGYISTYDCIGSISDKYYNNDELFYFTEPYSNSGKLFIRKFPNVSVFAKNELGNITSTNNITIDGGTYSSPTTNNWIKPFVTATFPSTIGNDNKFLKWPDNNRNLTKSVILQSDKTVQAYYKAKFKSDNQNAISDGSMTRAYRDTNNTINQIHESQGCIFYSRSTNNGASFSNEEIVNNTTPFVGNSNAFISEIKQGNTIDPPSIGEDVVAIFQRREGNNEYLHFTMRYTSGVWVAAVCNDFSFYSANAFNAKARVFAQQSYINYCFRLISYLKPYNNTIQLLVRINDNSQNEVIIDEGNITDYSVVRSSQGEYQVLYFAYIKDNQVYYKACKFREDGTYTFLENNPTLPISSYDNQTSRTSPDISLRNGYPVVAYRGTHSRNWQYLINGNNYEDGYVTVYLFPVIVKCRNNNDSWTDYIYESDGQHHNEQPNIEGSKDASAYLVNFKAGTSYKQFAKIDGYLGYHCSPSSISDLTDAKLVKGSYTGLFGSSSYPMLFSLKPNTINSQCYDIEKHDIAITNQGSVFDGGFDNLGGTLLRNDIMYNFILGPISVSNTFYEFEDSDVPTTINSAVEFNSNMVSNKFSLSNNDTLILGAFGNYINEDQGFFTPLKYHVDLIHLSTGNIFRELFRDTINVEDSVDTEYLRGFIITGIQNGTDSFYVQLSIDTTEAGDGDEYQMAGIYVVGGTGSEDNPVHYKKKVHFENDNSKIQKTNIVPGEYSLSQNYPNPFNPVTNIKYQIPKDGLVTLKVYDITGREIANLVKDYKQAGYYTVSFNGSNFASGVYFYRIQSGDFMQVKKMILIK
jgi:hypothetical protein